jgi:hypothetical protein
MAPRKPNKSRRDKPNDSLANQVGGWLGGAAKAVGRAAAQNPLVAQNIRYGKAVAAGPTQLAKTAAIDLAAGAAGAGVSRAAAAAVRAGRVVNPVAAARNLIKGEQVIVHGTAKKITGSMLKGVAGEVDDTTKVVFGWNPRQPFSKDFVPQRARSFATGTAYGKPDLQNSQRNVVIARVKKSDTFAHQGGLENEAVITAGNARISSVIKAPPPNASRAEIAAYSKSLANEVRKAGSRLRGADRLSELQQRIELAKYSKSLKKVPKKK